MLSLEFDSFDYNKKLIDYCIEDGLITDWFLFSTNRLRLAPPLIITEKEIEQACEIILNNIKKITRN
jgi:4-aminobutyrate aminotransferase-like enzyme